MSKAGAKPTRFLLSEEQIQHINAYKDEFTQRARSDEPKALTTWKQATAESILNHDLFKGLPFEVEGRPEWKKVC